MDAGKTRIVVIDDDELVLETLRDALQGAGYDVLVAADGEKGLAMLQDQPAAAVVTDILMPQKDGIETIRELRRRHPTIRILAISGGAGDIRTNLLDYAEKLGADASLPKPFQPQELIAAVRRLLQHSSAET